MSAWRGYDCDWYAILAHIEFRRHSLQVYSDCARVTTCLSALSSSVRRVSLSSLRRLSSLRAAASASYQPWVAGNDLITFDRGSGCARMLGVVWLGWRNVVGNILWLLTDGQTLVCLLEDSQ